MQGAIDARVMERAAWIEAQESRIHAAWSSLTGTKRHEMREAHLAPGERAPGDLPIAVVEEMLVEFDGRGIDPDPKPSQEFLQALDAMRDPKDPASFELGSDTYMPEAVRLGVGRYRVRTG
jgi:hypothetical protein